jgi:L-seryl-tRNA(Ser) seleniumtransferase
MRADKLTLAALEATLALYDDPDGARAAIPALAMLTADAAVLEARARALAAAVPPVFAATLGPGESAVGGGAFPTARLPTTLVILDGGPLGAHGLALRLRLAATPVVTRVAGDRVLLDPRTLRDADLPLVAGALAVIAADIAADAEDGA